MADIYLDFWSMFKNCKIRAIRFLAFLLKNKIKTYEKKIYKNSLEK